MSSRRSHGSRSLQQIATKNLYLDLERSIINLVAFGVLTSPTAHEDSIQKLRKVQRRILDHMHQDDRPDEA